MRLQGTCSALTRVFCPVVPTQASESTEDVDELAFLFIKPHAVTPAAEAVVVDGLRSRGIDVLERGTLGTAEIDSCIDAHYGMLAQRAMSVQPAELPRPSGAALAKFEATFGCTWDAALADGTLVNLATAQKRMPHLSGLEMERLWRSGDDVPLFSGTYAARVETEGTSLIVINGFYAGMRAVFTDATLAPHGVRWMIVGWRSGSLTWEAFKNDVVGATNPAHAAPESLRGVVMSQWRELGLPKQPHGGDNGVHASASPIEALHERRIWLGRTLSSDPFALRAVAAGVTVETLEYFCSNPRECLGGGEDVANLFDALEGQSSATTIEAMRSWQASFAATA